MAVASIVRDNMFYEDCKVFLEGIEVPVSAVSVSYGVASPPMCSIVLPSSNILRDLPEKTKIHIFFRDIIPSAADANATPKYEWRLLFDGEYYGVAYATDANGTNITITGIHSTGYLDLMQVMTVDAAAYVFNNLQYSIGEDVIPTVLGTDRKRSTIIENILKGKTSAYKTMADVVYSLLKSILEGSDDNNAVKEFYQKRMTNKQKSGGWKVLDRIFKVTEEVTKMAPVSNKSSDVKNSEVINLGTPGKTVDPNIGVSAGANIAKGISDIVFPTKNGEIKGAYKELRTRDDGSTYYHGGVDIATSHTADTPVQSLTGGVVESFFRDTDPNGYGDGVIIRDPYSGARYYYAHCRTVGLKEGDTVVAGQHIANVPSLRDPKIGRSSGPHLHLEIRDSAGNTVNPSSYIRREG